MAMTGKLGRSPGRDADTAFDQVSPPSADDMTSAFSFGPGLVVVGVGPLHHVTTMRFVAPEPVGAPLATSRLGNVPVCAPRTPSNVGPATGSKRPQFSNVAIGRGRSKVKPPLNERVRKIIFCRVAGSAPCQNTYSVP